MQMWFLRHGSISTTNKSTITIIYRQIIALHSSFACNCSISDKVRGPSIDLNSIDHDEGSSLFHEQGTVCDCGGAGGHHIHLVLGTGHDARSSHEKVELDNICGELFYSGCACDCTSGATSCTTGVCSLE